MSYAKSFKKAQCETSVETTTRKGRLHFTEDVQRTTNERLTRRMVFVTMSGGENPAAGRPDNKRAQCLADDLRSFGATEVSTDSSPVLFEVETVLCPRAAKKSGKWSRGMVEAADCFRARWHRGPRHLLQKYCSQYHLCMCCCTHRVTWYHVACTTLRRQYKSRRSDLFRRTIFMYCIASTQQRYCTLSCILVYIANLLSTAVVS